MKLKILQIIPNLSKGGAERLVLNICNEIAGRENYEILLVNFNSANEYEFLCEKINRKLCVSKVQPSITGKIIVELKELNEIINEFKPDVIHSHLFESEMVLSRINYKANYFVHFHDNMKQLKKNKLFDLLKKENIINFYEKKIILKSYKTKRPKIIAISKNTESFIRKNLPSTLSCFLLPNAIELKRFNSIALTEKTNRIVMIGSLKEKKGQDLAIKVIKELHNRGLKVYLDILGEGAERKSLQDLINGLDLQKYVILHGNVNYPEDFFKNAFLYLHTAKYEPFGLVLVEAMAAGLPVVSTDGKGNRELIVDGKNGFMSYSRNVEQIASLVENIIRDEKLRKDLSIYAKNYVKKFDIKDYVDKLLQLYQLK
ncbi:MAG: glycosyltransferase [Bacteroidota bacterium]